VFHAVVEMWDSVEDPSKWRFCMAHLLTEPYCVEGRAYAGYAPSATSVNSSAVMPCASRWTHSADSLSGASTCATYLSVEYITLRMIPIRLATMWTGAA
jgi:hypothetical protein